MILRELLETLMTPNAQVVLIDLDTDTEIASMKVAGFGSLDDTIENREVKQWYIVNNATIKVMLGAIIEP